MNQKWSHGMKKKNVLKDISSALNRHLKLTIFPFPIFKKKQQLIQTLITNLRKISNRTI